MIIYLFLYSGESYNHTNMNEMKGLTVYGRGDQQLSNNQVKHNNVQIVSSFRVGFYKAVISITVNGFILATVLGWRILRMP